MPRLALILLLLPAGCRVELEARYEYQADPGHHATTRLAITREARP